MTPLGTDNFRFKPEVRRWVSKQTSESASASSVCPRKVFKHPLLFLKTPETDFFPKNRQFPVTSGHRSRSRPRPGVNSEVFLSPAKEFEFIAALGSELTSPPFLCNEKKTRLCFSEKLIKVIKNINYGLSKFWSIFHLKSVSPFLLFQKCKNCAKGAPAKKGCKKGPPLYFKTPVW